ncbi:aspartate kinase [Stutzerimonas nitrititolerans]|uniref:aspartate kinase n=1 Tax=Stutzerimonas nitrititolerans TaxID=2482751 RepID=UPI00026D882D|nr:aspartate kinase [Stutzerimonas nitrititolerans]AFN76328.1 aspartate kinase [Stutzerimonas stutzeri DSM 10701]WAD25042.1 aspartate kinase [Pseudomonadaceae bacterium T75]SUD82934.1 aspartate kinase [Stutzerimonas stutzeri]MBT1120404.1 aspartate kinase [Stutzerimonas nitrititolerans]NNT94530.1 aspartate kinase [Stutzerimonas nitrititolerans]
MHTVEKIGGTSMSRFDELLDNIFIGQREGAQLYQRVFVVSAYSGMTNLLLEHKKTGEPGVYQRFADAQNEGAWLEALQTVRQRMLEKNAELFSGDFEHHAADQFINSRIDDARECMSSLQRLCAYGHFQLSEHLMKVREMLASLGEAHSAFNAVLALKHRGINARMVDLTGWHCDSPLPFEDMVRESFEGVDLSRELVIATGYTHCAEGLMSTFDRGYSEITFAQIAAATGAREAIIHKEFHLSSADPNLVGADKVVTIGRTNYDVADQLSNLGMEAIHPRAAKTLRRAGIELRIKNAFEPEHAGTLISQDYKSEKPCVEIIAGRKDVFGIEVFDQDMLGDVAYDIEITKLLKQLKLYVVNKDSDANSITYYLSGSRKLINRAAKLIEEHYPAAEVTVHNVAIVSAIGSDLKVKGILAKTVAALAEAGISIQAVHQSIRQVEMQCVVNEEDYDAAIAALHRALIEPENHGDVIAAA